jgi:ornithine cyclodeaminase/alanine dehydrogenase-like protein (mu-crystallin family)
LHVNAVGADFPGKHELPEAFLKRCLVVPDFTEQACKEGECQNLETTDIGPDLATMVRSQGANLDGRNRLTVFDSTGYALEDLAAAELAIELAAKYNIGSSVQLAPIAGDPLDPYQLVQAPATPKPVTIGSA